MGSESGSVVGSVGSGSWERMGSEVDSIFGGGCDVENGVGSNGNGNWNGDVDDDVGNATEQFASWNECDRTRRK